MFGTGDYNSERLLRKVLKYTEVFIFFKQAIFTWCVKCDDFHIG